MAIDCSAQGLATSSAKLVGSLTYKQLLAALVYIQCTANGMDCTPETLSTASKCLLNCMTEKQLLAALVYIQCTGGGGAGTTCGDYGGAQPPFPATGCGFIIDTSNMRVWTYANGNIG